MAEEIFEAYSDLFDIASNPYGMVVNFNLSPSKVGGDQTPVAKMRVSWEMAKVLGFMLIRHIKTRETETKVSHPIPPEVLNQMKIAKEDWDAAWASPEAPPAGL